MSSKGTFSRSLDTCRMRLNAAECGLSNAVTIPLGNSSREARRVRYPIEDEDPLRRIHRADRRWSGSGGRQERRRPGGRTI
jgi:hypothetical protein